MCSESANFAKAAALPRRSAMAPSGESEYIVSSRVSYVKGNNGKGIVDAHPGE